MPMYLLFRPFLAVLVALGDCGVISIYHIYALSWRVRTMQNQGSQFPVLRGTKESEHAQSGWAGGSNPFKARGCSIDCTKAAVSVGCLGPNCVVCDGGRVRNVSITLDIFGPWSEVVVQITRNDCQSRARELDSIQPGPECQPRTGRKIQRYAAWSRKRDGQRSATPHLSLIVQNGNRALSLTSFMTKKVRVCRTPGSAISFSPCNLLKSAMSRTRIFRR